MITVCHENGKLILYLIAIDINISSQLWNAKHFTMKVSEGFTL